MRGIKKPKLIEEMIKFIRVLYPDSDGTDVDHITYCLQHGIGLNGGRTTQAQVIAAPASIEQKSKKQATKKKAKKKHKKKGE